MSDPAHDDPTCSRRHRLWAGSYPPMSCAIGCPCNCHKEKADAV